MPDMTTPETYPAYDAIEDQHHIVDLLRKALESGLDSEWASDSAKCTMRAAQGVLDVAVKKLDNLLSAASEDAFVADHQESFLETLALLMTAEKALAEAGVKSCN